MDASYITKIAFTGKPDELQCFLDAFNSYKERQYFSWVETEQCGDESLNISAWGSSGYFTTPNDIDLFRDLAEAAPGASFNASNFGSNDYGIAQKLDASLAGSILHISAYFEDDEVMEEIYGAYTEYFHESLSCQKLAELFRLDTAEFDEGCYEGCCEALFGFSALGYEQFMEIFAPFLEEDVDEDTFGEIMQSYNELGIKSFDDFRYSNEHGFGTKEEMDYDPISKTYI